MPDLYISSLVQYGINAGLMEPCDKLYTTNRILHALQLDSFEEIAPADLPLTGELEKHSPWVAELKEKYSFTQENITAILREEVGMIFARVLEHAGVYKRTEAGCEAFLRFVSFVNGEE